MSYKALKHECLCWSVLSGDGLCYRETKGAGSSSSGLMMIMISKLIYNEAYLIVHNTFTDAFINCSL